MSTLSGNHSLGGDTLCCGANQEKRPLLRGEAPQTCVTGNGISRRDKSPDGSTTAIIQIPLPAPERAEPRHKPEKCKTILAFLFSSVCLVLNLVVLAYVHERVPDRDKVPPLPDIFFDLFPAVDEALEVSEIIIIASVWTCVLLIVLHRHRWIVFRRVCIMMGVLYAMRAITMLVTQVPIASKTYYCSPKANSTNFLIIAERVLKLFSGFGLSINGQHTYCGDYIFSGHTLILTLCYLIIKEYSPQRCRLLHMFYFCTSCIGVFCVLLARGHYLIDVVLGYYVTTRVFWIYHGLCAAQQSSKVSSVDGDLEARGGNSASTSSSASRSSIPSCLDVSRLLSHASSRNKRADGTLPATESSIDSSQGQNSVDGSENSTSYQSYNDGRRKPEQQHPQQQQQEQQQQQSRNPAQDQLRSSEQDTQQQQQQQQQRQRQRSHSESEPAHLASQSTLNYLGRVWWFPLFRYFEMNVIGPVPRQYEWPLPWPRRFLPRTRIS